MILQLLFEYYHANAILDKLEPTELFVWESVCRTYSKRFFTPLHQVLEMNPEFVIKHVFADQYADIELKDDINEILDILMKIEDPEYERLQDEELEKFATQSVKEETQRLASGKSIMQSVKEGLVSKRKSIHEPPEVLKSGFIDLSYLAKSDNEG